jgi:hypothetical protein
MNNDNVSSTSTSTTNEITLGGRPSSYGCKSTTAYYAERQALWIKQYLDKIIETNNDLSIDCKKLGRSKNTIYQRVYFGWLYLCDKMDDEKGTYTRFRNRCCIRKEIPNTVTIHQKAKVYPEEAIAIIPSKEEYDEEIEKTEEENKETQEEAPWWSAFIEYLESTKDAEEFKATDRAILEEDLNKVNRLIGGPGGPYHIKQLDESGIWLKRK